MIKVQKQHRNIKSVQIKIGLANSIIEETRNDLNNKITKPLNT